jgi:hypothetical protein
MTTTAYRDAVNAIADDIIRQLDDGDAPARRVTTLAAGGFYFESVRVFYADICGDASRGLPRGVCRIAIDMDAARNASPRKRAHEVQAHVDAGSVIAADDIANAVADMIDTTQPYAN